VIGQPHAPAALPLGRGPQSWFGGSGEEKKFLAPTGYQTPEPQLSSP